LKFWQFYLCCLSSRHKLLGISLHFVTSRASGSSYAALIYMMQHQAYDIWPVADSEAMFHFVGSNPIFQRQQ